MLPPGAAKLKKPLSFTADAHLDFLSFQVLPDLEGRNAQAAVLYLCLGGVLCAITRTESRHVPPRWSGATQRECIASLRHKISFTRCKPWKEQGLNMYEKRTRISRFASPTAARCNPVSSGHRVRPELALMARTTTVPALPSRAPGPPALNLTSMHGSRNGIRQNGIRQDRRMANGGILNRIWESKMEISDNLAREVVYYVQPNVRGADSRSARRLACHCACFLRAIASPAAQRHVAPPPRPGDHSRTAWQ